MQAQTGRASRRSAGHSFIFRKEGEYWTIAYGGQVCRLRDSIGLRYLAQLLRKPGVGVSAAELQATQIGRAPVADTAHEAELARVNVTRVIKAAVQRIAAYDVCLGNHLQATVRTGASCSYTPDPRVPVEWEL